MVIQNLINCMSKLIACWGAPGVGNTTFAVSLAKQIATMPSENNPSTKNQVAVIFASQLCPTFTTLYPQAIPNVNNPNKKDKSIGNIFALTNPSVNDILEQAEVVPSVKNIIYLGYAYGQNPITYSSPVEEDIFHFFYELSKITDYIIVDCCSDMKDLLTQFSLKEADYIFQTCGCDYKSMCFFVSNLKRLPLNDNVRDENRVRVFPNVKNGESPYDLSGFYGKNFFEFKNNNDIYDLSYSGILLVSPNPSQYTTSMKEIIRSVMFIG